MSRPSSHSRISREDRIQCVEKAIDDVRRMLGADIDAVAGEIAFGQHLLGDERLVGQRVGASDREARSAGKPQ